MKFNYKNIPNKGYHVYTLILDELDLRMVCLDEFDKTLIKECESAGKISDLLLALEAIVRNIEK